MFKPVATAAEAQSLIKEAKLTHRYAYHFGERENVYACKLHCACHHQFLIRKENPIDPNSTCAIYEKGIHSMIPAEDVRGIIAQKQQIHDLLEANVAPKSVVTFLKRARDENVQIAGSPPTLKQIQNFSRSVKLQRTASLETVNDIEAYAASHSAPTKEAFDSYPADDVLVLSITTHHHDIKG